MSDELPEGLDIIDTDAGQKEKICAAAEIALEEAKGKYFEQSEAISTICQDFIDLKDSASAELFFAYLSKKYKISKKIFTDTFKKMSEVPKKTRRKAEQDFVDDGTDPEVKQGWFIRRNCYWFYTKDGGPTSGSNFIIEPLFHIDSKTDNKRLVRIINEDGLKRIIDIPSNKMISVDQFAAYVFNEGDFIWTGCKAHYTKILKFISKNFPMAKQLITLGWQREGFYAFANGIYNGVWQPVNEFGITANKEKLFFSPAFSVVYNDVREDDDEYANDRYFVYKQAPCTFGQWSLLMMQVYGNNAIIGMAFAIASIFRDIIYEKYKIFPHLFLFGEKQSGKSQMAWSISNLFFHNFPAFNLNSGTHVGLSRRGSRSKNCVVWIDEYSNDIDIRRFQLLKAAYDGVGHEKGKMTQDSRTSITQILSSFLISGQFLPTLDDNSLLTRSCLLSFIKKNYTKQEMDVYEELKELEIAGISSLVCDVLEYRKLMEDLFARTFSTIQENLKAEMNAKFLDYDERLVRNYCCLLAPIKIILESNTPLKLSFDYETMYKRVIEDITSLTKQIKTSESISTFWTTVEYLLDEGKIQAGIDFKISMTPSLAYTNKEGKEVSGPFPKPENLLFIRFSRVHPLYMEKWRQQTGRNGIDLVSIMHYLKNHKSYVGSTTHTRFDTSNTSAFVFKYGPGWLDINLERTIKNPYSAENKSETKEAPVTPPKQESLKLDNIPHVDPGEHDDERPF